MPSPSDYTGPVRYNTANTHVICRHCRAEIERGSDYAVLLTFPDDTDEENPIGPYCSSCMPTLKVCCDCNQAYFGEDEIKYFNNGIYYCKTCAADKDICSECGETHDISVYNGEKICKSCFDAKYFKCTKCVKTFEQGVGNAVSGTTLSKETYPALSKRHGDVCDVCFDSLKRYYKPKKVRECASCGAIHCGGGVYCNSCKSSLPKCDMCNTTVHKYSYVKDASLNRDVIVCDKCKPSICKGCGKVTMDELQEVKGIFGMNTVCPDCTTRGECTSCLTYGDITANGMCMVCNNIYEAKCTKCGEITNELGSSCRACDKDRANVSSYSYKPKPLFHFTEQDIIEGDNIFMGFENEVTVTRTIASVLKDMYNSGLNHTKMTAKSDSSIRGSGFEMVSHPYTLRALKEEKIDGMFVGIKGHDSCGMHVHVDRRCLSSDTHLYKVISFIHENEKFCDVVAGREFTSYAGKLADKPSKVVMKKQANRRHQRVNLQNKATIEFRLFATSDRKYKLMMRIEFVHALISYSRNASIKGCKGFSGLIHYITANKRKYNNLYKFVSGSQRFWNKS